MYECISPENKRFSKTARAISVASCSSKLGCFSVFFSTIQWSSVWLMSALGRERGSLSSSGARILSELLRWRRAWMYLIVLQNVPQGWSTEHGHCPSFFFLLLPLFASRTQLPHLTFSIWPLPRGEIARVSKGGRHTSWILLSFNLHSPFSPWWCTWIRNEDIAQLRGFLRLLLRSCHDFFFLFWSHNQVLMHRGSWVYRICATLFTSLHLQQEPSSVFQTQSLPVFHFRAVNNLRVNCNSFCLFRLN